MANYQHDVKLDIFRVLLFYGIYTKNDIQLSISTISCLLRKFDKSYRLKIKAESIHITDAFKPYWKIKGQGEMTVSFLSDCSKTEIESLFGYGWIDDVIDSSRAKIYCPDVSFMWLSTD